MLASTASVSISAADNLKDTMVPGEGFEPPTFGLQNRCTTTVLTRQYQSLTQFSVSSLSRFCPDSKKEAPRGTPV